jgi:hypothetical protein
MRSESEHFIAAPPTSYRSGGAAALSALGGYESVHTDFPWIFNDRAVS